MNLNYCLLVTGPAYGNQRASSALQFAEALLARNHHIEMVFFYQDGVCNANSLISPASDEFNIVVAWQQLAQHHLVELHVCVAASLRRGIANALSASDIHLENNIPAEFKLSGLGILAQAALNCDRFLQF